MKALTNKTYRPDFDYLIGSYIKEYDIKKANINILYYKGVLSYDQYFKFKNSLTRKEDIGWFLKYNPDVKVILDEGIMEARQMFIESNNLSDNDIISCRNDAVFVINKNPVFTRFGNIEFINKNEYITYIKLEGLDIYYYYDPITSKEVIDIKGMSKENEILHEKYFMEFLLTVLNSLQTDELEALSIVQGFHDQYINKDLDVGYYRTFNTFSHYELNPTFENEFQRYAIKYVDNISIDYIDINFNLYLIRLLYKYVSNLCFKKHRA